VQLGVVPAIATATTVDWQVSALPAGLELTPTSGTLYLSPADATDCAAASTVHPATQPLTLTAASPGSYTLRMALHTAAGQTRPDVDLDVEVPAGPVNDVTGPDPPTS
jgi:hypothetical protein